MPRSVQNDVSWGEFALIIGGFVAMIVGGELLWSRMWVAGAAVAVPGIIAWVSTMVRARRRGPAVMDFEKFGRTFRWW